MTRAAQYFKFPPGLIEDEHVAALLQALSDRPGLRREVG